MNFLSRDQILEAADIQREEVDVPEWGGKVLIQALDGEERDSFEASMVIIKGRNRTQNLKNVRAKLVSLSIIDPETGQRLFSDADVTRLGTKSASALDRVFTAAARLSGLQEGDVEELVETFDKAQSNGFGSI